MTRKTHYTVARALHWVTVYFAFFNLFYGWRIGGLEPETRDLVVMIHAGLGTTIGLLVAFRWWWRRSHGLYRASWRTPIVLVQLSFYPLLLIQVATGVLQAAFIDYDVAAFGLIEYSALAAADERWHRVFLAAHGIVGAALIVLVTVHALRPEPERKVPQDPA